MYKTNKAGIHICDFYEPYINYENSINIDTSDHYEKEIFRMINSNLFGIYLYKTN
jgi:hypothetical protein